MSTGKRNADEDVVMPKDHLGNPPTAWIVETPVGSNLPPYMTLKPEVAMKRYKAGDHVTPYHTQRELPQSGDDL